MENKVYLLIDSCLCVKMKIAVNVKEMHCVFLTFKNILFVNITLLLCNLNLNNMKKVFFSKCFYRFVLLMYK